jgi:VanZ family protein
MRIRLYLLASCLYSGLILFLSLANLNDVDIIKINGNDKLYHCVCYAIMAFLWSLYFSQRPERFKNKQKLYIASTIIAFGIIIEYLQLFLTNYRSFDWWDVLANTIGVILGIFSFLILQKQFNL